MESRARHRIRFDTRQTSTTTMRANYSAVQEIGLPLRAKSEDTVKKVKICCKISNGRFSNLEECLSMLLCCWRLWRENRKRKKWNKVNRMWEGSCTCDCGTTSLGRPQSVNSQQLTCVTCEALLGGRLTLNCVYTFGLSLWNWEALPQSFCDRNAASSNAVNSSLSSRYWRHTPCWS